DVDRRLGATVAEATVRETNACRLNELSRRGLVRVGTHSDLQPSNYSASIPPSTAMDAPVMYEASAEATKAITCAISSGVARRLTGTVETSAALLSSVSVKRVSIPVSVVPGATTFTRTPLPATSSAADLVIPSTACLLATYTDAPAAPTLPYADETLTMLPAPCAIITRS